MFKFIKNFIFRNFCQSCGMPLKKKNEAMYGTNFDGTINKDYCAYCFKKGKFLYDVNMNEMAKICAPHLMKKMNISKEKAIKKMLFFLPFLKRWEKK